MHNLMDMVLFYEFGTSKFKERDAVPEPRANHSDMILTAGHPNWVWWKKVRRPRRCDGLTVPFQCDVISAFYDVHENYQKDERVTFSILRNYGSTTYLRSSSEKVWPSKKDSQRSKQVRLTRYHFDLLLPSTRSILKPQLISPAPMTVASPSMLSEG